jgi:hypothetical protein
MPARPEGVYPDDKGWYFKVTVGRDALSGRREQTRVTSFRAAATRAIIVPRRAATRR